jgi:hypothetical protein
MDYDRKKWLPITEFCAEEKRSQPTVRKWCEQGLRHAKVGKERFIDRSDFPRFIESFARGGNGGRNGGR